MLLTMLNLMTMLNLINVTDNKFDKCYLLSLINVTDNVKFDKCY